jgi:protein-disulfide isomerase
MLRAVASRKQQKEEARAARERAVAQLKAEQGRRTRMLALGGVLIAVVVAAVIVIAVSSSNSGGNSSGVLTQQDGAPYTHAAAQADVATLLDGIPQSGNILGSPIAPVTITEFGDLVCPICDEFAVGSEPTLIQTDVRTGKVKLLFRGSETASSDANGSEYVASQVAARAAGLQGKEWNYILLLYDEQPQTIKGQDAELVPYVTAAYLKNRAQQITGLNIAKWQRDLGDASLKAAVAADSAAAQTEAPRGTPTVIVTGPKGSVTYDANGTLSAVPTIAQLNALIAQVS